MTTKRDLEGDFNTIREQLAGAKDHLALLRAELERLEQAGMYDSIPTTSWVSRNGSEKVYLMLLFPKNSRTDAYDSPNGKKKNYIGCKPDKIKEARVMIERRKRYNALNRHAGRLADWIAGKEQDLSTLATRCAWWNKADSELLGPDPADLVAEFDPKVEGTAACQ